MAIKEFFNLDFDTIKAEIKNYIKNNSIHLKDYNFEGSAISEIINILSYVTQYQSFYLNMVANELYISTAQLKKNVYKLSNMLGYVPNRASAPYIQISLFNSCSSTLSVPKYTKFQMGDIKLVSLNDLVVSPGQSDSIIIYEGEIIQKEFIVPERNAEGLYITTSTDSGFDFEAPLQKYLKYTLDEDDYEYVDNNFLYVFDKNATNTFSGQSEENEWIQVNNENPVLGEKFYYLQYLDKLTIMFDNGNFFKAPDSGTKIYIHYLKTSGTLYNNSKSSIAFDSTETLSTKDYFTINANITSYLTGGTEPESLENIKNNAPLFYVTNNRAVTESDYNAVIKKYPGYSSFIDAIVWGGEKEYINEDHKIWGATLSTGLFKDVGHIYLSFIKPSTFISRRAYDYEYLSTEEYNNLETYLSKFKILTLFFKRLDPNILYFRPIINAKLSTNFVDTELLTTNINNYFQSIYTGFNKELAKSNITQYLDNLAEISYSDISYTTELKVLNSISNVVDYRDHKAIKFNHNIEPGSLISYIAKTAPITSTFNLYNDTLIYNGTYSSLLLDNNSEPNAEVYPGQSLYLSICINNGTITAGSTLSFVYNTVTVASQITISSIHKFYDNQISSSMGAILADTTTIGYINYDLGFATISSNSFSTLSQFRTYTFKFDYVSDIYHILEKETFLSPKTIRLTLL